MLADTKFPFAVICGPQLYNGFINVDIWLYSEGRFTL